VSVDEILENVKLPTLSKTLNDIIELEKINPVSIFNDIIKIIEKDPMLSVHIMKVANSPLLGFAKTVRSISHAVSLLGITQIRNIAFSFSVFDFIKKVKYSKEYGKVFKEVLKRSLMMSAIASILAKNKNKSNADELYISGLISNLGQMILFLYSPEKYSSVYIKGQALLKIEEKIFGTDHIEIGILFCRQEKLPSFLESAISNQYKLSEKTELNKIIYIASGIANFLLTDDQKQKKIIFDSLEGDIKKILGLSMEDIQTTINDLPIMMDSFMTDFPEVQSELTKIINTSSEIIIKLMKNELDLVMRSKEQVKREQHISGEKKFITHMLNLSKEFSVLLQPEKLINKLLEFFKTNLEDYDIKMLYRPQRTNSLIYYCNNKSLNGKFINISLSSVLLDSKSKDEPHFATREDIDVLGLESNLNHIAFPVSYHKNNFGFLILGVEDDLMKNTDYIIAYLRIIANIIANSFQNYFSFVNIKVEIQKKEKIANELINNDKKLINYESNELVLSRSNVLEGILPIIFHKLKNKLTPILGYSQLVATLSKDEKIVEKLKKIERNANELTSLLESLRYSFKSEKIIKKKENINDIIFKMESFFFKLEESANISIGLDLDHSIEDILLDRGQIINLIINLVENSVNSLENKDEILKKIEIRTLLDNDTIKLIIKDNGIGIRKNDMFKIWAPFYSTNKDKAGIGLTACEKVLMNHGAKYKFISDVGKGAEFIAEFPVKILPVDQPTQKKEKFTDLDLNVLIVDDEESLVVLMKEILQIDTKLNIYTTTRGNEAIKLIDEHNFSVIVSDIQMPGVSGIDIFNHLKQKGISDRLVMVTANPYLVDIADFLKSNKIKYLKKPFELMEFRRLVNEKIDNE